MLEVEEILDLIIFRPPAFLLVKSIYKTSISPNQITWLSLLFGVFGAFLIFTGTATAYTFAAICFIIYNILGQKVKSLVNEYQTAGYKTIHWDGRNERGNLVSSGIYFYKFQAGNFVKTKKMVIAK